MKIGKKVSEEIFDVRLGPVFYIDIQKMYYEQDSFKNDIYITRV